MPRLSVVVPVYNVEEFLDACLESVVKQTFEDFEVVMVDDGSTDGSVAIAERFADRDERFRLVSQPNGGLSKARNTGTLAAAGKYLAFLDSDDALPPNAYELLVGALEKTGSDFATGNVHRLTRFGTSQSPFLARTFGESQLKTHVTKFRPLLADRPAWNKVWRREFWDRHGFRFPEGRLFEDTPVTIPAHFLATSVDVIADPVYYWRIREGGDSITQRRLDPRLLRDRITAVTEVSERLGRHGPRGAKRWYDENVVADDLRYYLNALEAADEEYQQLFLDRVNAFLDDASPRIYGPLPAIDRLKWHLVRRRLMPELLEVLRFQREELGTTPPVRVRGRWYGDYPFRTDRRLGIPKSAYRLEGELTLRVGLEELALDGDRVRLRGHAYINGIGAPAEGAQRVAVAVLSPGRLRRVRLVTSAVRARTRAVHRPDVTANARQGVSDLSWSGFEAVLDPRDLRSARRWTEGTWELFVTVRAAGVKRRRSRFSIEAPRVLRAVTLPLSGDLELTAGLTPEAGVTLGIQPKRAAVRDWRIADGAVELTGELRPSGGKRTTLELRRRDDAGRLRFALATNGASPQTFTSKVPVERLLAEPADRDDEDVPAGPVAWELTTVEGGRRTPVALSDGLPATPGRSAGTMVALMPGAGGAELVVREPAPVVGFAQWSPDGTLELRGNGADGEEAQGLELVLASAGRGEQHAFIARLESGGRFSVTLRPARVRTMAGELPLPEGRWELRARTHANPKGALMAVAPELEARLGLSTVVDHKPFSLEQAQDGRAVLVVRRDLDEEERGAYHQRRLRRTVYGPAASAPLRDTVVYSSFLGRQYSDSPRAIHEELVRRGAPVEHLWVVRDGRCNVPATATALREGSREYHEALGRARFVVSNDHFPDWFARRPEQVCLQTWHGTPLKRLGFDVSDLRRTVRRFERRWEQQVGNWQYVLSPNRFTTPILRRAYAVEGEMLETGYPRNDVLARPDRDVAAGRLRSRLGIPGDARVVLYAPTYRDQVVDSRGRFRLDLHLDVERLRESVGDDTVVLFRKHHYIHDAVPATSDGFVRDVSTFPDATELMLVADVLLTDYSSMMFDFANTGRPMLFFTYDLEAYQERIRGFYFDFEATAPGPLVRTTDEVAAALLDLDAVRAEYAQRYGAFASRFCEFDDGGAAARVVDRVFAPAL